MNSVAGQDSIVNQILIALRCGRPGCACARGRQVHCPAHADRRPSLFVTERNGRVLVHCFAGCPQEAVLEALRARGLWETRARERQAGRAARRETRYEVRDPEGRLVAVHVRVDGPDGKRFRWELPDGTAGLRGMRVQDLPLYGVHRALAADEVVVVEGEKATDALWAINIPAVGTVTGASTVPSHEVLQPLASKHVYLWPDADEPGRAHMRQVAARLAALGCREMFVVKWPDAPPGGDAADFVSQHGDQAREAVLDLLRQARPYTTEPQPELGQLLDQVARFISNYVVCAPWQADLLALWVAHTWAFEAFDVTSYLGVTSAEKRSGKTRLLEVLELLVARPWFTANASVAAIARRVAADRPTLLLDEWDTMFADRERAELIRGVLNAGYRRGGKYSRVVGEGSQMRVEDFETFCPKAVAGIGGLPDTVADRCLVVELKRRRPDEQVSRFRLKTASDQALPLRQALEAWADRAVPILRAATPEVPAELDDRAAEVSEPLLAIADLAGPAWATRAREAVLAACRGRAKGDESVAVKTLAAVAEVFREKGVDRVPTEDLLQALVDREDGPWAEWWGRDLGGGYTRGPARKLARLLARFGVHPVRVRTGEGRQVRGYLFQDLQDPLERYVTSLPPTENVTNVTAPEPAQDAGFRRDVSGPADRPETKRHGQDSDLVRLCDVVTFTTLGTGPMKRHGTQRGGPPPGGDGLDAPGGATLLESLRAETCPACGDPRAFCTCPDPGPCPGVGALEDDDAYLALEREAITTEPSAGAPGDAPDQPPPALEVDVFEGVNLLEALAEEEPGALPDRVPAEDHGGPEPQQPSPSSWTLDLGEALPGTADPVQVAGVLADLLEPPLDPATLPPEARAPRCRCCGGRRWWQRPKSHGGGWVCARCHPPRGVEPVAWHGPADPPTPPEPPVEPTLEDQEAVRARRRQQGLCEGCGGPVAVLGGKRVCSRCGWKGPVIGQQPGSESGSAGPDPTGTQHQCGGTWQPCDFDGWLRCSHCREYVQEDHLREWASRWRAQ